MNREEAIYFANCLKNNYTVDLNDMEAFCDMAIKALAQEPTAKNDLGVDCISREQALVAIRNLYPGMPRVDFNGSLRKWVDKYKPYIECDDAIKQLPSAKPQLSVPEVTALAEWIEKLTKECEEAYNKGYADGVKAQEPKTGHWIPTYGNVECSVCGSVKDSREVGKATHYCDFCGAKMVEPQERSGEE